MPEKRKSDEMLKVLECISNHYTKLVCSKNRGSHAYE